MPDPIARLEILGLRGFGTKQAVNLAVPNGVQPGSGLTVLVGPNNAGKSTVYEALRAFAGERRFSETRRNARANNMVNLSLTDTMGRVTRISTIPAGGAQTDLILSEGAVLPPIHVVPSRRGFSPEFSPSTSDRSTYSSQMAASTRRLAVHDAFAFRLAEAQRRRPEFDQMLGKMVKNIPVWTIDERENGQQFIRVVSDGSTHTSEGLGEGLISMLFIADALYDAPEGSVIVIDEPELSIHPAVQRRIAALLMEESRNKQIVCSTHSPYFLSIEALDCGGRIARVFWSDEGAKISMLSNETGKRLCSQLANRNNPHVFGLDAREAFFLEDDVVLVEGQEDVILYPTVMEQLDRSVPATFFGWGIGGAANMELIARMLCELGFSRVAGVLDGDQASKLPSLRTAFPDYLFTAIPADDIRDKEPTSVKGKKGLLDSALKVKPELRSRANDVLDQLTDYFKKSASAQWSS